MRGEVVLLGGSCGFAVSSASLIRGAAWTANTSKKRVTTFWLKLQFSTRRFCPAGSILVMSEDILDITTGSKGLRCQKPTIQRQLATDKELFGPKYKQCQSRETLGQSNHRKEAGQATGRGRRSREDSGYEALQESGTV